MLLGRLCIEASLPQKLLLEQLKVTVVPIAFDETTPGTFPTGALNTKSTAHANSHGFGWNALRYIQLSLYAAKDGQSLAG